jgi:hypothetical protein
MQRTLQRGLKVPEAAAGTAVNGAVALRSRWLARLLTVDYHWPSALGPDHRRWLGWIMLIAAVSLGRHQPKLGPDFNTARG